MGRFLVIDDHALLREAMASNLRRLGGGSEVVEAADADAALAVLSRDEDFDCILLDLLLPGARGFEFLNTLRGRFPSLPVVVVSGKDDRKTVSRCLQLGAAGFVPKRCGGPQLIEALDTVMAGGIYTPGSQGERPRAQAGSEPGDARVRLTRAQSRVLALLAQGKTNRQIGEALGLAEGTVKIHLTAVYKALGVGNRARALIVLGGRSGTGIALPRVRRGVSDESRPGTRSAPGDPGRRVH